MPNCLTIFRCEEAKKNSSCTSPDGILGGPANFGKTIVGATGLVFLIQIIDGLVKSRKTPLPVIPAKAGIQFIQPRRARARRGR